MFARDFQGEARALGFALDRLAVGRFAIYRDLILETSERFNLTAVRDAAGIERRHLLEALTLARALIDAGLLKEGCRTLDIGSGAGLPGLAIKIALPDLRLSLLEANAKRCQFLREAIEALSLTDVEVLQGRAEELAHVSTYRESYDLALARALAPLPALLEYALPFLRRGGYLAATKGSAAEREVSASGRALDELGGGLRQKLALETPGLPPQVIVIVEKTGATPERYPRRTGIPAKRPLI